MIPIGNLLEPIYNGYKSTARYIWDLMGRSHDLNISVREETITEMALMHLKELLQDRIHVQKYTPAEEKILGSDWEWLLIEGDRAIEFRVQAKRLYIGPHRLGYDQLHYEKGKQTKNLIENARTEKKIPLYCFFNYIPDDRLGELGFPKPVPSPLWKSLIPSVAQDYSSLGWTFAFAEHIWNSPSTTQFKKIGQLSQSIDFFNRDLEDIVNEYNGIKDDDQGDGGSKVGPKDDPKPDDSGGSTGIPLRTLDVRKEQLKVKSVSEDLQPYQKSLLKELGLYNGIVEPHNPPNHISMTVVTIIEYKSQSSEKKPYIPIVAPFDNPTVVVDDTVHSREQELEKAKRDTKVKVIKKPVKI